MTLCHTMLLCYAELMTTPGAVAMLQLRKCVLHVLPSGHPNKYIAVEANHASGKTAEVVHTNPKQYRCTEVLQAHQGQVGQRGQQEQQGRQQQPLSWKPWPSCSASSLVTCWTSWSSHSSAFQEICSSQLQAAVQLSGTVAEATATRLLSCSVQATPGKVCLKVQ